jgi:hypothetical protein
VPPRRHPLPRIYADTSEFGGCFDGAFRAYSLRFFRLVRQGRLVLLVSELVGCELSTAPPEVRRVLQSLPQRMIRDVELGREVGALRNAYFLAGVVGRRSLDDATHVAAAAIARADAIVSWNFKDIVRLNRIRGYNEVNARLGHASLTIISPREVRIDGES